MDIDWENIDCYVCCNHCDTLEFGEAPLTTTYIFAIRIHETIRLLEFDFNAGDEITLDADLLNEDSVSQITVYYLNAEDEGVIVHQCNINVSISSSVPNPCPLPDFVPDCPDCGDADYELTLDGEVVGIGAIPCGETTAIPIDGLCPISGDATYDLNDEDGNLISSGSIACGENAVIVAPNADIDIFDTDSNLLYGLSLLSNTPNFQVINDSVATLKDTANNTLSTTNILAEGSEDIIAPDATITYNGGTALTTVRSNGLVDIDFQYVNGNVATPNSLVGTLFTFPNPAPNYDPRDLVNHTTLNWINPFGNNNRFTDEFGGQTYTNNLIIDWTTYNIPAATVKMWWDDLNSGNEATALAALAVLNVAGFSGGWVIATMADHANQLDDSGASSFYPHAPFTISIGGTGTRTFTIQPGGVNKLYINRQYTSSTTSDVTSRANMANRVTTLAELGL